MGLPDWDNLQTFVHDWMKGLQELADSIAPDPDEDNSMLAFLSLPYAFDCTFYASITTTDVTDDYSGSQPWLISYRVVLMNNSLRIVNQKYVGKNVMAGTDKWGQLTDEAKAIIENEVNTMYSTRNIEVVNNYPDLKMVTLGSSYGTISIYPQGHDEDGIQIKFPIKNDGFKTRNEATFGATTAVLPHENDSGYYTPDDWSASYSAIGAQNDYSLYGKLIAVFDNQTEALRVVNQIGKLPYNAHNDVINYTKDGSEYKLYYGDNYLIYALNDNKIYNYQDLFTGTNQATTAISGWHPADPPIKTPTYTEVKHEDDPPEPDYTDDNFGLTTTGFSSNIGGAGNYWLMSLANLAGFISDFKTTAPAGAMISQNILSCYVNALNYEWETGQDNIVIHAAGAQNTPYTSTSQYDYIYQYNPHVVVGQYKVPRVTETFYDFNPYSTYELYIPFCGWIGLPDTVAGRNIRVYMDFDVATMSCKAYVMVEMEDGSGDTICGEITGSFGAPCPVQVIEGGLYKQAMINSGLQIASGVVSGLMGGAFGGPVGASMLATGGMNAVQGLASAYMAGNTNYGQTIGRAGDTSGLCGGHYCYIKITHPVIDEVVDTETFGHTTGYPCYMESELSDLVGTGFTVCLNPHVHVNCTQSEKDEIKQLLESGVIL